MTKSLATKHQDIKDLMKDPNMVDQFNKALPKMINADHFVRVFLTAINKTPKLAECTQVSLMTALLDCASMGLEPDGRHAHLIPYGNQCKLIPDYKGLIKLAKNAGDIQWIKGVEVCKNDEFDYTDGVVHHKPDFKKGRGEPYLYFSHCRYKDGTDDYDMPMTIDEINKIRDKSPAAKSGPWVDHAGEQRKKTVIKRHCKRLPQSPELIKAFEADFDSPVDITPLDTGEPTLVSESPEHAPGEPLPPPKTEGDEKPTPEEKPKKEASKPPAESPESTQDDAEDDLPSDDKLPVPKMDPVDVKEEIAATEEDSPMGPLNRARAEAGVDDMAIAEMSEEQARDVLMLYRAL